MPKIENIESTLPKENAKTERHESASSDDKREWKHREKEYHKRWPKQHTSSSSRDVSPWEDGPSSEHKKQRSHMHPQSGHYQSTERYARPPSGRRRMNSYDEDFDDEHERRPQSSRMRSLSSSKPSIHRSKEVLESENPSWYHGEQHWYPDEDDDERMDRNRSFDRNVYERSTYGPPFIDKPRNYPNYDNRRYYDKRSKYYRSYNRPDYEYDPYELPPPTLSGSRSKLRKEYDDFEGSFERGTRETRSAREYFYDRDRRSFDSNESYESGSRIHHSGEIYGSHDSSRNDFRERDRYKMSRRNQRSRGNIDDDSDEVMSGSRRGIVGETTGSLQRGQNVRSKHSNIKLDDDVWGSSGKYWKRPSSAAANADRMSGSGGLSGSDGERERRHRKKTRGSRCKEIELRSNYATIRYPSNQPPPAHKEFYDDDDDLNDFNIDEPNARPISPPKHVDSRDHYAKKKPYGSGSARTGSTPRVESKGFSEYVKPRYAYDNDEREPKETFNDGCEDNNRMHAKSQAFKKSMSKDLFDEGYPGNKSFDEKQTANTKRRIVPLSDEPLSNRNINSNNSNCNNKFSFDGFESDFNSPKQNFDQKVDPNKFAFDDREFSPNNTLSSNQSNIINSKNGNTSGSQQKLRFNENVSVSKFDSNSSSQQMFEDDFLQSWSPETPASASNSNSNINNNNSNSNNINNSSNSNNTIVQMQSSLKKTSGNLKSNPVFGRPENIKKSDSVNIFARKNDEDPFANDDFFNSENGDGKNMHEESDPFHWDSKNNFANFEDNKNI
jgi:disabled family protein 2